MEGFWNKTVMVIMIMLNVVGQLYDKDDLSMQDAMDRFLILPKVIFLVCEDAP